MNIIQKQRGGGSSKPRRRNILILQILVGCVVILQVITVYISDTQQQQHTKEEENLMFQPSSLHTTDESSSTQPLTVVYSKLRGDQSGWVIFDMLKAHAYCFALNITYGGACGNSAHSSDIMGVLRAVGWTEILPLKCPPTNNSTTTQNQNEQQIQHRIYPSNHFQHKSGRRMGSTVWQNYIRNHTDYSYFEEEKKEKTTPKTTTTTKTKNIVVHIRRRDVTPCCYPNWYLPNIYFKSMIEKFVTASTSNDKSTTPPVVHIYSQSKSYESWDDFNLSTYKLHLDGPVGDVWRAILASDIFIGSKSEFSRVPSLFANGLVVNPRHIDDSTIRHKTNQTLEKLVTNCNEMELLMCKNKDIWKNK